jgi:hypothetical protein
LLSGLVTCGVCGGALVGTGRRWRCKAAMRQACSNAPIPIDELKRRALAGIRDRLLTPEIIGRFARELQRELDEQQRTTHADRSRVEHALDEARRRTAKIVRRIEDDEDAPKALTVRLKELEAEEAQLAVELASTPDRTVVRLPANYEAVYAQAVESLEEHLSASEATPAREAIRRLGETIVVHDGDARGGKVRRLELKGDLFRMLEFAEDAAAGDRRGQNAQKPRSVGTGALSVTSMVAGTRIGRCHTSPVVEI